MIVHTALYLNLAEQTLEIPLKHLWSTKFAQVDTSYRMCMTHTSVQSFKTTKHSFASRAIDNTPAIPAASSFLNQAEGSKQKATIKSIY